MKKISFTIMILVVALASCKKTPEVNLKYVDVERDLITVGTNTATVQCDYGYIATLKKAYFYYGEGSDTTNMNIAEMRVVQNTLYVELAGLKESTTYSYYYEFHNGFNSMRTVAKTFKTETTPVVTILPTVITTEVTEIAEYSAQCGGEVTNDGGAEVTERGICWSTNENPTLNDNHIAAGSGLGEFTALMDNLQANTTYHVRAYATNEAGTAYGLDREFTTLSGGGGNGTAPEGAIDGLFSINACGVQVYFSQGNLQYQASTNTWRFADNQWDFVGDETQGNVYENGMKCDNSLVSPTYDGWIDLFYWGTSGYNHGANCYQPWSTNNDESNYYAYGIVTCNLFDYTGMADWGYNSISNGGSQENLWRVLTYEEWRYVLFERETPSNIRFAKAWVNGVNGLIILPDNWNASYYSLNSVNDGSASYNQNFISYEDWKNHFECYGGVFLSCALNREGTTVLYVSGYYWSSTRKMDNDFAYDICIRDYALEFSGDNGSLAQSVRLVRVNTQWSLGVEKVVNGDFEQGDLGFTSEYEYVDDLVLYEGMYNVDYDASLHHPDFVGVGHGGTGKFMIINGSMEPEVNVWTEQISVEPNTCYVFSTWVCTLVDYSFASLQFSINGTQIGNIFTAPSQTNIWRQFYVLWNSGNSTTATITILNRNTEEMGNDFGIDDISFREFLTP